MVVAVVLAIPASAQTTDPARGQQTGPGRGQRGAMRQGQRPALPPLTQNMDQQQLQAYLDAFALVQAERELQLTTEQYPNFVPRLTRLQNVRRRIQQDRRRLLGELRGLLGQSQPAREETVTEKLRALDDVNRRGADEIFKSYQELDSVLTPWQRGRFRLFEEQMERRKIDLLGKLGPPVR